VPHRAPGELAGTGVAAGLGAGAIFAVHLMVIAEVASSPTTNPGITTSTWTPLTGIASFVLGPGALHGTLHPGPVFLGLALHFAMSALVGVLGVAWIVVCLGDRPSPAGAALLGAAYGLFIEVVAMNLVVNPIQDPNVVYESAPPWAWWAGHGIYGAALGALAARRVGVPA
jgi:hypothetical protein